MRLHEILQNRLVMSIESLSNSVSALSRIYGNLQVKSNNFTIPVNDVYPIDTIDETVEYLYAMLSQAKSKNLSATVSHINHLLDYFVQ